MLITLALGQCPRHHHVGDINAQWADHDDLACFSQINDAHVDMCIHIADLNGIHRLYINTNA